jgi:hypothetical protein
MNNSLPNPQFCTKLVEGCSGLIVPDTLIRDNLNPILRCQYESETTI